MSLGEAQGAIGIDVDLLAAGDHGVQSGAARSEDGLVSRWAVCDLGWAVGGRASAEVELLTGGVQL